MDNNGANVTLNMDNSGSNVALPEKTWHLIWIL